VHTNIEPNYENLSDISTHADHLVHEAHDALERMETTLTLTEAKVALVRHLLVKRHHHELGQHGQ